MFILGLQGSPRKNGNTHDLLSLFTAEAEKYHATTQVILPHKLDIQPCKELIVCEKKGFCPIKDEMDKSIYSLVKRADIIVLAAPVFFYNVPAQIKALIDRCQMFWGRKYKLQLKDPNANHRQGFLLSCGASGGKKLFEGIELTTKIFYDALSVKYKGCLTYRYIEDPGQMAAHPDIRKEIKEAVKTLCAPFAVKKKILFVSEQDALRSQMAAAFMRFLHEGDFHVFTAGIHPLADLLPETLTSMEEKQLDLKHLKPCSVNDLSKERQFDHIIYLDHPAEDLNISTKGSTVWGIKRPSTLSSDTLRPMRDEIESKVKDLISILAVQ